MGKIERGKLIVIEGVDGSGKTTQTQLLVARLRMIGKQVQTIKYPRHNTPFFGKMVDEYLTGKFGPADKLGPHLASLLFACDRFETKSQLLSWLSVGNWIVPDRYMTSNLGHQLGKISKITEKEEFINWAEEMEYRVFGIPRPDLVIYLDLPIKIIENLINKRAKETKAIALDGHESNLEHLKKAQDAYRFCLKKFPYWTEINCMEHDELLPAEEIHKKIWEKIRNTL